MTTLISPVSMFRSDSIPIQTNSSSSTSTRFSLSLPIDSTTTTTNPKSNHYILKSNSLISALISPHHHHSNHQHTHHQSNHLSNPPHQTLRSSSSNHQNRLPRPRALSSSHLPPPFPSPSGTFLPPPLGHYLPLRLPSHSERKSRSNKEKTRSDVCRVEDEEDHRQEGLRLGLGNKWHKRSSSLHTLPSLDRSETYQTRKRSLSSTVMDTSSNQNPITKPQQQHHPILIRDFGFPLNDERHYRTIQTDQLRTNPSNYSRPLMKPNSLEESFQSQLCLPPEEEGEEEEELRLGSNKPSLWTTTMRTERTETDHREEEETGEEEEDEEDGLREEIERRRESLDKSLQSIGRPSIGSNLDSSGSTSSSPGSSGEEEDEGLWVALYDFVAEGEGEMGIYEGEILRVLKVVCDGWVIARKVPGELDEDGRFVERVLDPTCLAEETRIDAAIEVMPMGLCPQNYLARI
ncbi:uncharacterized protein MELLADRAFT_68250 [Melampsora larici-populina 98AG31]|uniref:SH3 domain-containing protein n=1 Tax=Melampsora larici-populina (strain 98AG31 / pathotype 3-4-7) TaxID=747676 RepID=F4S641_MELLP|nr:uncharacterized protein MELLADRAFT_68250 [Melampsora larici-populina 98AG31]EGF99908.1 hypothetical protein MELLADRAFT_68250 [Melampsora larici-populina 98AG31]